MRISRVYLVALLVAVPLAAHAQRVPTFPRGTSYTRVHTALIHQGWAPVPLTGGSCGLDSCPSAREVVYCTGVGAVAPCFYAWRRGRSWLMVTGSGEARVQGFYEARLCRSITRDPQFSAVWHCNR